jgi:hypothetical protein
MDPQHPQPGDLHVDASDVDAVDLLPEEISKLTKLRAGHVAAAQVLLSLSSDELKTLGIDADQVAAAPQLLADLDRIGEVSPAADKMAELLRETGLARGHQLGGILSEAAAQAKRRAERDPEAKALLAKLEVLFDYTSGPAVKGARTKAKQTKGKAP